MRGTDCLCKPECVCVCVCVCQFHSTGVMIQAWRETLAVRLTGHCITAYIKHLRQGEINKEERQFIRYHKTSLNIYFTFISHRIEELKEEKRQRKDRGD